MGIDESHIASGRVGAAGIMSPGGHHNPARECDLVYTTNAHIDGAPKRIARAQFGITKPSQMGVGKVRAAAHGMDGLVQDR